MIHPSNDGFYDVSKGTKFFIGGVHHPDVGTFAVDTRVSKHLLRVPRVGANAAILAAQCSWEDLSHIYRFLSLTEYGVMYVLSCTRDYHLFFGHPSVDDRLQHRVNFLIDSPLCYAGIRQGVLW